MLALDLSRLLLVMSACFYPAAQSEQVRAPGVHMGRHIAESVVAPDGLTAAVMCAPPGGRGS